MGRAGLMAGRAGAAGLAFLAALGVSACASAGAAPTSDGRGAIVPPPVATVVDRPPLDQVHWGMLAVAAESGEVLLSRNAHRKFIPASNMKVLVTAAALARLGPDHRFRTTLHGVGRVDRATGTLEGDLVVTGSGDPTLSDRYWPDDVAPLRALVDSVVAAGVRTVDGALVVDASSWDSTTVAGTWMWGNLPGRSSAVGGAFAVAEGEARIVVTGGAAAGVPASVSWEPGGEVDFVVSRVRTVGSGEDADIDVSWLPESRRLEVRGTVQADSTETQRISVRDPVRQATALLHRLLEERGVEVRDGWRIAWDAGEAVGPPAGPSLRCETGGVPECPTATAYAALVSPPLMEVVKGILEPSQNWMAEQLVRVLGASDTTRASWRHGLDAAERILVEEVGVDSLDLRMNDGSGLSAYNLVTPRAMVRIFRWASAQPWGAAYRDALAEPGEDDSTLRRRLEGLEGRLWGKTGTISNVNSLSGYLVDDDGREVVFSVLTNGSGLSSSVVREGMDEVVRWLAGGAGR